MAPTTQGEREKTMVNTPQPAFLAAFFRDRRRVLLTGVLLLNLLPAVISALSSLTELLVLVGIGVTGLAWILLFGPLEARKGLQWTKWVALIFGWAAATVFTAIFSQSFSNAYLSFEVLILSIFLVQGLRYGLVIMGLTVVTDMYHIFAHGPEDFESNLFALTVLATVGLLSWTFISNANKAKDEAQRSASEAKRLASEATAAKHEAERLAEQVTKLNRMILTTQDNERRRLARDIHDGPLQSIGVQLLAVERTRRRLDRGELELAQKELDYLKSIGQETVSELRGTVNFLRNTLLDIDLRSALENLARKYTETSGLSITVRTDLDEKKKIPGGLELCLYHLVVEALNNIKNHAQATTVSIDIFEHLDQLKLMISDNGLGFDYHEALSRSINEGHIGLHSMKERASELGGQMALISRIGGSVGTEVTFSFPSPFMADAHSVAIRRRRQPSVVSDSR
jgi:signal transduction histidine kinase